MVFNRPTVGIILLCYQNPILLWSVYLLAYNLNPSWVYRGLIRGQYMVSYLEDVLVIQRVVDSCTNINPNWRFFFIVIKTVSFRALCFAPPLPPVFVTALGMEFFLILIIEIHQIHLGHILGYLVNEIRHLGLSFYPGRHTLQLPPLKGRLR